MERTPKTGELYRHFKNKMYQIVTVAEHSETGEKLVIYQALYGNYGVYARPLEMFVSEVDHEKYPFVTQKYRFEKVVCEENVPEKPTAEVNGTIAGSERKMTMMEPQSVAGQQTATGQLVATAPQSVAGQPIATAPQSATGQPTATAPQQKSPEETVNAKMMDFFDADDLEEKYNILASMQDEINNHMINNMAVAMDVVIPEGKLEDRYEALKSCIRTKQHYERERIR